MYHRNRCPPLWSGLKHNEGNVIKYIGSRLFLQNYDPDTIIGGKKVVTAHQVDTHLSRLPSGLGMHWHAKTIQNYRLGIPLPSLRLLSISIVRPLTQSKGVNKAAL